MTRDEAITAAKQLSSFRTTGDAVIRTYLQQAQQKLESEPVLPDFLSSERSHIFTTVGEGRIPIPSDFLREVEEGAMWYIPDDDNEDEVELHKDDMDHLRSVFPRTLTGVPTHYALDYKYFRLFPIPDAIYRIQMVYFERAALLTSNIENVWLKHVPWVLIGRAGSLYAMSIRDKEGERIFKEIEQDARGSMVAASEAREHTNRRYQMGGPA